MGPGQGLGFCSSEVGLQPVAGYAEHLEFGIHVQLSFCRFLAAHHQSSRHSSVSASPSEAIIIRPMGVSTMVRINCRCAMRPLWRVRVSFCLSGLIYVSPRSTSVSRGWCPSRRGAKTAEWRWHYAVDTCGAKDDQPLETEIDIRKSSNQPLEMELELNFDGTWNLRAKRWTMGTMNIWFGT